MPFRNEHAARLKPPGQFKDEPVVRVPRNAASFNGREYAVIRMQRPGSDKFEDQAFRYPTKNWPEKDARKHAKAHDAILFEPATGGQSSMKDDMTFTQMCEEPTEEEFLEVGSIPANALWCIEPITFENMVATVNREVMSARHLDRRMRRRRPERRRSVAVIPIYGVLTKSPSLFQLFFGNGLGSTTEATLVIQRAADDPEIDSILLRVDSPGGSVEGLAELVDAVTAAAAKKEVIAQVEGMAASAALHVASQAHKIFAHRMDKVGSIGTRMMVLDISEKLEKEGITVHIIDTGKFKSAGVLGAKVLPEHLEHFQEIVDAHFKDFTDAVAEGRKMTKEQVAAVADGRIFMAAESVENGLIDGIQTTEETLAAMIGDGDGGGIDGSNEDLNIEGERQRLNLLNHEIILY